MTLNLSDANSPFSHQVEFLEEKVTSMTLPEIAESAELKKTLIAPMQISEPPKLAGEDSKEIPGVRADLKLVYEEDKGRHLVATRDIYPGI